MKNRSKVANLKTQLIEGIKKECQFIRGNNSVIEFKTPFKIYLDSGFLWATQIEGNELILQESFNGKLYYVRIDNVNDVYGLAYMLDRLEEQDVRVIDLVETE